jgi:tetratricopeptide (TPR) repeat protein
VARRMLELTGSELKMSKRQKRHSVGPAAALALAESALTRGAAAEAARLANQVLRRDRDHVGALEILARALWRQNRFEQVADIAGRLIRLDPYNGGYRTLLGAAQQCLGQFGEAMKSYASATDARDRASEQLIADLRDWQRDLVSTLVKEDRAFNIAFSRDAREACKARGFEFLEDRPVEAPLAERGGVWQSIRPS